MSFGSVEESSISSIGLIGPAFIGENPPAVSKDMEFEEAPRIVAKIGPSTGKSKIGPFIDRVDHSYSTLVTGAVISVGIFKRWDKSVVAKF